MFTGFFIANKELLFSETAYKPDDKYDYGNYYKYTYCHTGLKDVAYYFAACKQGT